MESSQSFYSNEVAHQKTLKILMASADVNFIFECIKNNSDDTETNSDQTGDGVTEMDSQDTVSLDSEMGVDIFALPTLMINRPTMTIRNDSDDSNNGETSAVQMGTHEVGDGEMKMDSQETIDSNEKKGDGETSAGQMGTREVGDGEMKVDRQETIDSTEKKGDGETNNGGMDDVEMAAVEKTGDGVTKVDSTVSTQQASQIEIVKIPAHKQVLAALSPVFNAEFNGPMKEQGDVKMVGTSPAAFNTFLQFFYEHKINLTMDSVEDVMDLIDRYDVITAWPICVEYLKKKLTVDDILWALSMAMKFQLDDLKTFCLNKIQNNCAKVCSMIEYPANGKPKLLSNPNNRPLSDADLVDIFPQIFATVNLHLSNPTMVADQEIDSNVVPFTVTTGVLNSDKPLDQTHYFTIASNQRLWLTHLDFLNLRDEELDTEECNVKMWIQEKDQVNNSEPVTLFTHTFKMTYDDNDDHRVLIKPNPIEIKPTHFTYRVYAQISPYNPPVYAKQTIRTNRHIEVAPNTIITFINPYEKGVLAKALFFRNQQP